MHGIRMAADIISKEKLDKEMERTEKSLNTIKIAIPKNGALYDVAMDVFNVVESYIKDAKYFRDSGDFVNSFGSLYYAYGWMDCGVRLGIFDGGNDYKNFTHYR